MAVVVWVYSGGGEAEVRGFFPFLDKTFPGCRFERKTPVRDKPGPKPNKASGQGRTGKSLIEQIKQELPGALKAEPNKCDLILVFDDLDCRDSEKQKEEILSEISKIPESAVEKFVGFAAPEIEAWIIADWNNSIAKNSAFRGRHERMRWWLSTQRKVPFDSPESCSEYDRKKDCCQDKLSETLIESTTVEYTVEDEDNRNVDRRRRFSSNVDRPPFSKGLHTPLLLREIDPNEVKRKCPLFRELYNELNKFCRSS
jgi:hypothetical protein